MSGVFLCLWYLVGRGHLTTARKAPIMRNPLEQTSEGWRVRQTADYAPVHGIPRPSLIECNGVRRDNTSAQFCLWDFTLNALIYRLVTERGSDLANYDLTFTKKDAKGDWVAL